MSASRHTLPGISWHCWAFLTHRISINIEVQQNFRHFLLDLNCLFDAKSDSCLFFFPVRDMGMIKVPWLMSNSVRLCRLHIPFLIFMFYSWPNLAFSPDRHLSFLSSVLHRNTIYFKLLAVSLTWDCISSLGYIFFSHSEENNKVVINGS